MTANCQLRLKKTALIATSSTCIFGAGLIVAIPRLCIKRNLEPAFQKKPAKPEFP
jgi:hypothetical protein